MSIGKVAAELKLTCPDEPPAAAEMDNTIPVVRPPCFPRPRRAMGDVQGVN